MMNVTDIGKLSGIAGKYKLLLIVDKYVHTNYKNSLYRCQNGEAVVISTRPLEHCEWENVPMNTLIAYQDGKQG